MPNIRAPVISSAAQRGTNVAINRIKPHQDDEGPCRQQGNNDRQDHDLPDEKVHRFKYIVLQKQVGLLLAYRDLCT